MIEEELNLTLIGMPGSGKTTVGKCVAECWGYDLLDTDRLIEEREKKTLEELIDRYGLQRFVQIEAGHIRSIAVTKTVIATGGSVVYDENAMKHLQKISTVIYLDVPLAELEQRVGDLKIRGVVIASGMSVADLWHERDPLYRKYAELIVISTGTDPKRSAEEVMKRLGSRQQAAGRKQ
jgi:shikimate kinase